MTFDSAIVVRGHDLTRVYRLYTHPLYRFLDVFAFCPPPADYVSACCYFDASKDNCSNQM